MVFLPLLVNNKKCLFKIIKFLQQDKIPSSQIF